MRPARACLLVLVALVLAACASAPTVKRSPQERALHALEDAAAIYEATRAAVAQSYVDGTITEAQRDAIAPAGRAAEQALRAATASLNAWLALGDAGDPAAVETDLAALRAAVAGLVDAWRAAR